MRTIKWTRSAVSTVVLVVASAPWIEAQARPDTAASRSPKVTTAAGPQYRAGSFARRLLGSNWRDVWITPVRAPVLDLETHAGGLVLERRGGGFQSLVLHLKEEDGWRGYRFRSVDKVPIHRLMPELRGTLAGDLWQDQTSRMFPAAPLLVHPLHEALQVLQTKPALYAMGDSPRLEAQRDTFAHMLGTMELKGQEAPEDQPGFAGSRKVKGTESFIDDLNESREHRLDEHEFLAVRLIDFLVNDPDRSMDNFDWVRFGEKGAYTWRPLPKDRDQAFVDARGLLVSLVARRYAPKLIEFGPAFDIDGLTFTPYAVDRRLLQRLDANDFRSVAQRVQRAVTDSVIDHVVAQLPPEWRSNTDADERIGAVLRARRDGLPEAAMAFYELLAGEVDVHGTAEAEHIEVVRHADGSVTVTISDPERPALIASGSGSSVITTSWGTIGDRDAFYSRTFVPSETNEVRIYAAGGDDVAVVRGAPTEAITVRIIGGKGDDTLTDSAGGSKTFLYDAEGSNRLTVTRHTGVNTSPWKRSALEMGERSVADWWPDWGESRGWAPSVDYNSSAGIIVGIGPSLRQYGFRRLPHHWEASASAQVGTRNRRVGVVSDLDYRAENSPRGFRAAARATQLEYTRFFGFGNDSPDVGRTSSIIDQKLLALEPSFVHYIGWRAREGEANAFAVGDSSTASGGGVRPLVGELRVGGSFGWIDPEPAPTSPLITSGVRGANDFGFAGARIALELDRTDGDAVPTRGWTLDADAAAYPPLGGDAFGNARARSSVYVPLAGPDGLHLALRAGGSLAAGNFPVQFASVIGGRKSLRGYSSRRFAGDAAIDGGAELRVPVGTLNFIVRSRLGVFALADAGRVWFEGDGGGGWHTGVGGGFWLAAFGRSMSVAYARGEGHKLYLSSGMFY